jgi:hypothetical protein
VLINRSSTPLENGGYRHDLTDTSPNLRRITPKRIVRATERLFESDWTADRYKELSNERTQLKGPCLLGYDSSIGVNRDAFPKSAVCQFSTARRLTE